MLKLSIHFIHITAIYSCIFYLSCNNISLSYYHRTVKRQRMRPNKKTISLFDGHFPFVLKLNKSIVIETGPPADQVNRF